ncbi:MAG: hypothetical protein VW405_02800 [Rhodospirillaceae bacterium]
MANEGGAAPAAGAEAAAPVQQGGLDNFDDLVGADPGPAIPERPGAIEAADADGGEDIEGAEGDELDAAASEAEASAEDEAPDFDEPEEAPEVEPIHGLEPQAILDAIKDGNIPEELHDHLMITQTINGEDVQVSLAEARKNGMRLSDYSRSKNELASERQQFDAARDDFAAMVESWKVNEAPNRYRTRMQMERWLGEEVMLEMARDIADEQMQLAEMGEAGRAAFLKARRLERQLADKQAEASRLERQTKDRSDKESQEQFTKRINTLRDTAFKAAGLPVNPQTDQLFRGHLRGLYKGGEIGADLASEAAAAVLEDWSKVLESVKSDQAKAGTSAQKAAAGKARLAARPAARGGGKPGQAGQASRPRRGGVADFDKLMGLD